LLVQKACPPDNQVLQVVNAHLVSMVLAFCLDMRRGNVDDGNWLTAGEKAGLCPNKMLALQYTKLLARPLKWENMKSLTAKHNNDKIC
jgi:hypothetical protein